MKKKNYSMMKMIVYGMIYLLWINSNLIKYNKYYHDIYYKCTLKMCKCMCTFINHVYIFSNMSHENLEKLVLGGEIWAWHFLTVFMRFYLLVLRPSDCRPCKYGVCNIIYGFETLSCFFNFIFIEFDSAKYTKRS